MVDEVLRAYADMHIVRANERSLAAELEEAHLVVSSVSTSVIEATIYGLPVFVHDIPYDEGDVVLAPFSPRRRFRSPDELTERLRELLHQRRASDETAELPERHLRRALFGESGRPRALAELLTPLASG